MADIIIYPCILIIVTTGSSTIPVTSPAVNGCRLFGSDNDAGILNTIFIITCLILALVLLVVAIGLMVMCKSRGCYKINNNNDDDQVTVIVGNNSVTIWKSKMNNIKDFFRKIDLIMLLTIEELETDKQQLNEEILDQVSALQQIMNGWQNNDSNGGTISNRIQFDSNSCQNVQQCNIPADLSALPSYNDLMPVNDLEEPPDSRGNYYNLCEHEKTIVQINKNNDILSLLLPTLAGKI